MAVLVTCDFHNHSCLSPCGSLELSPSLIARLAKQRGLELLALTDHNSALNTPAFEACARREGIRALFGIEATSAEEVHVICLFSSSKDALAFGEYLSGLLLPLPYNAELLGDQVVVDEDDNVLDLPEQYFGSALTLEYGELCNTIIEWGGLVIPAHIDRPMFGAISQLGFLPDGPYSAVEAMRPHTPGLPQKYSIISGSDAHYPEHVGRRPFGLELPDNWADTWDRGSCIDISIVDSALKAGCVKTGLYQ